MDYTEIAASVRASDAEAAADVLRSATGGDVWIENVFSQPDLESDAIVDANAPVIVRGYARDGAAEREAAVRRGLSRAGIAAALSQRTVAAEDWAESWKQYFNVERYGQRIIVVPSWRTFAPAPDDVVLTLDPGMAFGTGQHETTRMCLEAIERAAAPGMRVLDVGCGSGILSLAAAKLGAREVRAVDVDPECIRVTAENARLNDVDEKVYARCGSVGATWPFDAAPSRFDVVVANIIARVIIEMARPLVAALGPGGRLIVSGIIGERAREVGDALQAAGARIVSVREMGDWRCIEACAHGAGGS